MHLKYLIVSAFENSFIVKIFERHSIDFDFFHLNSLDIDFKFSNKIVIFENVESNIIYKFRQKNFLARFILISHNQKSYDFKELSLCHLSAIVNSPIKEEEFFKQIIKCDEEIIKIEKELFIQNNNSSENKESIDTNIKYSKNETILLNLLMRNENIILSQSSILEYFNFLGIEIKLKTFKNLLSSIRQKNKNIFIENIYGEGYKYKKSDLTYEDNSLLDNEYRAKIKNLKNFYANIDISCSYLLNKLNIDRVCFMEYKDSSVSILDEKVVYPQKKVLEQLSSLEITDFHKNTISFSLKHKQPYVLNFDNIVNLYFIFPKKFKGNIVAKSILYFPFNLNNKLYAIGLHQNSSYRRWENREIKLLKEIITLLKANEIF